MKRIFGLLALASIGVSLAAVFYFQNQPKGATGVVVSTKSPTPMVSITPTPTPSPTEIALSLLCFNTSTKLLRTSDVNLGCLSDERSLGAMAVSKPSSRPTGVNPFLYVRFLAAQSQAKRERISLRLTSGFRTYALQAQLFKQAVKKYGSEAEASKWVLPPNISHHPWGLALDINYPYDRVSTKWLEKYGYRYGLCRAYENEWWHFEAISAPGEVCPARLPDASTTDRIQK